MTSSDWQLRKPVSAIIFDCDGTLTTIEGIDYLAENNGVGDEVKQLTANAMGKTGLNIELYKQRLDWVKPTQEQVNALGQAYFDHRVPDIEAVIKLLQRQHKTIYLVSAGLYPAVSLFGKLLHVAQNNIFAVNISFNDQGHYFNFDTLSPLVTNDGKRKIVTELLKQHENIAYVGDGLNDLAVKDLVTRFIGYGGIFFRENIAEQCQFYINTSSLSSLLPLVLTQQEYESSIAEEKHLLQKGWQAIQSGSVKGVS